EYIYCFFFQAEDGIRGFHVTGVQTCALPISRQEYLSRHPLNDLTPRTITAAPELLRRLDTAPEAPAVTDLEEYALGTVCVAVPVRSGNTLGSLGVSLPVDRLSRLAEVRCRLLPTAGRVTRSLSLTI